MKTATIRAIESAPAVAAKRLTEAVAVSEQSSPTDSDSAAGDSNDNAGDSTAKRQTQSETALEVIS